MSDVKDSVSKIKKIVEKLKAKKKKQKHIQHRRGKPASKDRAAKPEHNKRQPGSVKPKKQKAVMQGPHGGQYVVLGNGKKKYGVTKSLLSDYVKTSEISDFTKKFKGDKNGQ